jgi:hypothetical protein
MYSDSIVGSGGDWDHDDWPCNKYVQRVTIRSASSYKVTSGLERLKHKCSQNAIQKVINNLHPQLLQVHNVHGV